MMTFLLKLLLTLSTGGNPCELGTPVDWTTWGATHRNASIVVTYEPREGTNFWIYQDGDTLLLFVFKENVKGVLASGRSDPHGKCAVEVKP